MKKFSFWFSHFLKSSMKVSKLQWSSRIPMHWSTSTPIWRPTTIKSESSQPWTSAPSATTPLEKNKRSKLDQFHLFATCSLTKSPMWEPLPHVLSPPSLNTKKARCRSTTSTSSMRSSIFSMIITIRPDLIRCSWFAMLENTLQPRKSLRNACLSSKKWLEMNRKISH